MQTQTKGNVLKMRLTRAIVWAAATDAGDRSMRAAGRTEWSEEDFNAAAMIFAQLSEEEERQCD
jgi:hypothetical protein